MVSRAAKHVFSRYLRKLPLLDVPNCVAHLLNCLVGFNFNPTPAAQLSEDDEFSSTPAAPWTKLDVASLRQELTKEVYKRYRFTLSESWWNECKSIALLREVCLKMGFQIKARDYSFEKVEKQEIVNGNGKSKKAANGVNGHKAEETTFYPEDILNVVPVVKDAPLRVYSNLLGANHVECTCRRSIGSR